MRGLFAGGIATTDDHHRLIAEARERAVANGAGGYAVVLEFVFRFQAEIVRHRAGGNHDCFGLDDIAIAIGQFERPLAHINIGDDFGNDPGPYMLSLFVRMFGHQVPAP